MISRPVLCTSLIGRDAELAHLLERRRAAAAGNGGLVLVAGEPGVGKSRLVRAFRERTTCATARVASAACREFAQRPLGPALDVLAQLDPRSADATADAARSSQRHYLEAVSGAFAELGATRATAIVIEDLHWADVDLLHVLAVLAERAATQRLLFIATYRDNEIVPAHPLHAAFGRLLREPATSVIHLGSLSPRATSQLLHDALGGHPSVSAATLNEIRTRSDGNPLFAEELLRHAVDSAAAGERPQTVPLPHSLQAVVRERLSRCDEWARNVLSRASLFGRRFDIELMSTIFGEPVVRYLDAMRSLRDLQLVDALDDSRREFAFRHALTRDVVYGELLAAEARPLHLRIAEAIEAMPDASRRVESLAHHFWEAGAASRSAPYCSGAGDGAAALHAYEDAALWYERAARAFGGDGCDAGRALMSAGRVLVQADEIERGTALHARAADIFFRAGQFDDYIRARAMHAGPLYDSGRQRDAVALLEETCAVAADGASRGVRDRLYVRLGLLHAFASETAEAERCLQAVDPEALAVPSLAGEFHFLRARIHALRGERTAWSEAMTEGLRFYDRAGSDSDDFRIALSNAAVEASALGDIATARAYQARALNVAENLKSGHEYELSVAASIELYAGNLAGAARHLDGTSPPVRLSGRTINTATRIMVAVLVGEQPAADLLDGALVERAAADGDGPLFIQIAGPVAYALSALGRNDEVQALAKRIASAVVHPFDSTLSIAVAALLSPDEAPRLSGLVRGLSQAVEGGPHGALADLLDAIAAGARGDAERARRLGLASSRAFGAIGWLWFEARAAEVAGKTPRALETYRRMGAFGEVRRLGGAGIAASDAGRDGLLTPREREVAALVAAGAGNRAAADALSISEKAVEKYLTAVYAKLGLTSRAQLVAFFNTGRAGSV
jgi:DNA-binding CsgD family transcriptional regulator